ncbi:MAG: sulfite exporter TauE/SafE family protein [Bergeyella sp.]
MEIIGYIFAVFIGLLMGLIGGGGSILGVPVFVYLFGFDAVSATALSLFVVGVTSLFGTAGFMRKGYVNYKNALLFGLPSVLGVLFSRRLVLPNLPHYIINRWGITLTKDSFLLLLFSILMLIASFKMISKIGSRRVRNARETNYTLLISQGLLVGIVTGLVGAGGGFLIVPALVMLIRMPMKEAVGTSLFIICINSLIGFLSSLDKVELDWVFLLKFSGFSVVGVLIGAAVGRKIEGNKLKPLFGWIILAMGIFIIIRETFF